MINSALTYAKAGIPIFPCAPDTKAPLTPRGFHNATIDESTIRAWWERWSDAWIGMPTGTITCIDVDAKHADPDLAERFEEVCRELGFDAKTLPKQTTPNGNGAHYFFRSKAEIRNRKLATGADNNTIIETRGAGGYVCVAPSPGYKMVRGDLLEVPLLSKAEIALLMDAAKSFDQRPSKEFSGPIASPWARVDAGLSPGDDYNQRGDVGEVLRAHGWHAISRELWRRPGKDRGISATWDKVPGKFFVFSSNAHPFEPEASYSPFAVYTVMEHGGDFGAAAGALRAEGFGGDESFDPAATSIAKSVLANWEAKQRDLENRVVALEDRGPPLPANPFTDLAPYFEQDLEPELPTVAAIDGGGCLFYAGRLNEIHAEPAVGKTNINIAACVSVLDAGGVVLFIDPEDTPIGITRRLRAFGVGPDAVSRIKYLHNPDPLDLLAAIKIAGDVRPDLVIADGLAEMLAQQGLSEDKPIDLLPFFRRFLRPFAEAGAAVVVSDHVTKDSESRGRWSRGSGAKLGRYDGAVYEARIIEAYGPRKAGAIKMVVSKDRNGGVGPVGTIAAEIHFKPDGNGLTEIEIKKPDNNEFQPTALMEKVCEAIRANPSINKKGLRAIGGKSQYIDDAIASLVDGGFIEIHDKGAGKGFEYRVLKPYPESVGLDFGILIENGLKKGSK